MSNGRERFDAGNGLRGSKGSPTSASPAQGTSSKTAAKKNGAKKKGGKNSDLRLVSAAGAVLHRGSGDRTECAVVHRPRYDDWSLPKGKVDPGESLPVTAVREIVEETGFTATLGRRLGTTGYPLKANTRKEVTYWSAVAGEGDFRPNDEVDELRWLSVGDARDLVSYGLDRKVLDAFADARPYRGEVVLVRHARAGKRSEWKGDDALRPLDKTGRTQAELLAPVLRAFGVTAVHAAPRVRCEQTVTPFADEAGLEVTVEPTFADEAFEGDPEATLRRLVELADAPGLVAVCSQGGAIPGVIGDLCSRSRIDPGDTATKKAGMWVLGLEGERAVFADRYPSPMPVR